MLPLTIQLFTATSTTIITPAITTDSTTITITFLLLLMQYSIIIVLKVGRCMVLFYITLHDRTVFREEAEWEGNNDMERTSQENPLHSYPI